METKRNAYRILMRNLEGKRSLERPRRRWVDYITIDLRGTGCGGMDWVDLAQNRDHLRALVNMIMNARVPLNVAAQLITSREGLICIELLGVMEDIMFLQQLGC
jgi:hypothetical protein